MNRWLRWVFAGALALLLWAAFQWLFPPPEKVIRQQLQRLARLLTVERQSSNFARLAAAGSVVELFAADVALNLSEVGQGLGEVQGRDGLREVVTAGLARVEQLAVEFPDVIIQVAADQQSAGALLSALAHINGERNANVAKIEMEWRVVEGQWRISRVTALPLLER
jgi:hypothetical protein